MSHDESQLLGVFSGAPVNGLILFWLLYLMFMEVFSKADLRHWKVRTMNVMKVALGCGQNSFHLVWKPKNTFSLLIGDVKSYCEKVLRDVAGRYGYLIRSLEVMPDHIHVFLSFKPTVCVSDVFHKLKGISARRLFQRFPELRKRYWGGHLWSPENFSEVWEAIQTEQSNTT